MKTSFKSPPLKLMAISAAFVSTLVLSSCGGGGSSSEDFSERPRTLDDLILTLDDVGITMEFRRGSTSPTEATAANPETGSVAYLVPRFNGNEETSLGLGTLMEIHYPQTFQTLSYTYQPINDISGLLTLNAISGQFLFNGNGNGRPSVPFANTNRATHISLFPSAILQPNVQWSPNFLLTFINDGVSITDVSILARPQNVTNINLFGIGNIPLAIQPIVIIGAPAPPLALANFADGAYSTGGQLRVNTGAPVPVNYTQEELTGTIADMSLDDLRFVFTPTTTDPTNLVAVISPQFTIAFSNAEQAFSSDFDEEGNATYSFTLGTDPIGNLTYEYDFTDGTDIATLVLSGNVPRATTGSYTLNYTSSLVDNAGILRRGGNYVISAPGQTYDGEIGTFTVSAP